MKKAKSISPANKISITSDTISRTVQGEEVILNLRTGMYFGLNPTGTQIWSLLKGGLSLVEVSNKLTEEYGIPLRRAQKDVMNLVQLTAKKGLVEAKR